MYELYKKLFYLYPKKYRDEFGNQILLVFKDLYNDELKDKGRVGFVFWILQFADLTNSLLSENMDSFFSKGFRKYFNLNNYNIIGGLLLLPLFTVTFIDLLTRIAQRDLVHYNRPVYSALSHTLFYQPSVLFIWIVFFPLLAILLNILPIIKNLRKKRMNKAFIRNNFWSFLFLFCGIFFLFMIRFHDFAPCFVHGILLKGINDLGPVINFCNGA